MVVRDAVACDRSDCGEKREVMMRGSGSSGADLNIDVEDLVSSAPSASALRWRLLGRFISSSKPGAHHRSPFP